MQCTHKVHEKVRNKRKKYVTNVVDCSNNYSTSVSTTGYGCFIIIRRLGDTKMSKNYRCRTTKRIVII